MWTAKAARGWSWNLIPCGVFNPIMLEYEGTLKITQCHSHGCQRALRQDGGGGPQRSASSHPGRPRRSGRQTPEPGPENCAGTQTSGVPSMTWVLSGVVCPASVGEADRPRGWQALRAALSSLSSPHRPTCRCCSASSSTAQGWPNRTLPSTSPSMNSCFWMPAPPHLLTPQSCFSM